MQSRKRAAPGASPLGQDTKAYNYAPTAPENADFANTFDYSNAQYPTDSSFTDQSTIDANNFAATLNGQQGVAYGNLGATGTFPQQQSTDLVRRARNSQLATAGQEQWNDLPGYNPAGLHADEEDEVELERKVALAKRDAQGKRKQIPPFVQKLSSFLDDQQHNQDLIRWSDDGRSFIVVDEDEFARTLIPELFKHNNYASFVRQLNMYGFHKTVNITDGSLRQSEKARKGVKPPSMYSHPYFRRNRPDLLWLIQKPSTKVGKRKREGDVKGDSDDERQFSPGPEGRLHGELGMPGRTGDLASLPRTELVAVRQEIQKLQSQQRMISRMISQLKEQNDQFYRQASAFQQLHDRHENSINAILTFLATFYNRSLDGHAGQNLMNMFNNTQQASQQHGSVVEDFTDSPISGTAQTQRLPKRQPLLLTAPPNAHATNNLNIPGSAVTAPTSQRSSVSPPTDARTQAFRSQSAQPEDLRRGSAGRGSTVTASPTIKNDAPTPNVHQVPESDQMMSLINSVNATNASTPATAAPAFDFSSALDHYQNANGNAPLTPQQRDDMLAMMSNQQGGDPTDNNALVSKAPAVPGMEQLKESQQQLNLLENLQKQQDAKLQRLSSQLQPLSPTGTIAGLSSNVEENPFDLTGGPGDFDPNAFIDFDNFVPNTGSDDEINFNFGDSAEGDDGIDWDFGNNDTSADNMFGSNNMGNNDDDGNHLAPPRKESADLSQHGRVESVSTASGGNSPAASTIDQAGTPKNKRART